MKKCFVLMLLSMTILFAEEKVLYLDGQCDFVQMFAPVIHDVPFTIEAWAYLYGPGGGVYAQNPIFEQRSFGTVINASAILLNAQNGGDTISTFHSISDIYRYKRRI